MPSNKILTESWTVPAWFGLCCPTLPSPCKPQPGLKKVQNCNKSDQVGWYSIFKWFVLQLGLKSLESLELSRVQVQLQGQSVFSWFLTAPKGALRHTETCLWTCRHVFEHAEAKSQLAKIIVAPCVELHQSSGRHNFQGFKQHIWLVLKQTPLKNRSSSIGMMIVPNIWENKSHVPVTTNQIWILEGTASLPWTEEILPFLPLSARPCVGRQLKHEQFWDPARGHLSREDTLLASLHQYIFRLKCLCLYTCEYMQDTCKCHRHHAKPLYHCEATLPLSQHLLRLTASTLLQAHLSFGFIAIAPERAKSLTFVGPSGNST